MFIRILRSSTVYGLAAVVSRGLVFLILPLYVRALSPYDIGLYELFNSISLLLAVILPLEITQAIARLKSNSNLDQQGIKNQSTTAFTFTLASFGIFGAIALVLIILFGGGYLKEGISILVPIFAITLLLLNGAYYFLQNELRWSMQPRIYLWSTFINALVASSVSFLFLGFSNFGIIGLYLALNLGLLAGIATIIFKAPNLLNVRWKWDELISLLKFSIPLTFSSAFLVIASVIDRFVLSYSLNLDTLGKYSVSLRVSAIAMLMLQGLQMAVLPIILGHADQMNRKKNIEKSLRFFLIIGFTVAFQLSAAAPEIMTLIATNAYSDGALLVPIILVGSVLSAVYPFAPGLWLLGFTWRMAILGMALAILSFIFSAAMVPIFGEIGASLAYALSGVIYATLVIIFSDQVYPVNRNYLQLLLALIFFCCGALLIMASIILSIAMTWRVLSAIILSIISCILLSSEIERRSVFCALYGLVKSKKFDV